MTTSVSRPRRQFASALYAFNRTAWVAGAIVSLAFLLASSAHALPSLSFIIDGDTYSEPFSITNNSTGAESVTGFRLNLAPAGICFDQASDSCHSSAGVNFAASGGTGTSTGLVSGAVSSNNEVLTLVHNDFGPGETFSWDIDVDEAPCGAGCPSNPSVYGNEMIGALAEVDFSTGQTLLGVLAPVSGNPDASQFTVTGVIPEPGTATLLSIGLSMLALRRRRI